MELCVTNKKFINFTEEITVTDTWQGDKWDNSWSSDWSCDY